MASKRGNKEGTITKRADGRWEARLSLPDGRRKSFYGKTRQEVARRLNQAIRDHEQGLPILAERQTVAQYLTAWLEMKQPKIEHYSYLVYSTAIRHAIGQIGSIPLAKLTAQQIEVMFARELEQFAPATVQKHHNVLNQALKHAVRLGLLQRNPVAFVDAPRLRRQEMHVFTAEEAQQFLRAVKGNRLEALYWLALSTGMRKGELLALRWQDIDFERTTVRVMGTAKYCKGKLYLGYTKTESSRRSILISPRLVKMLKAHRERQRHERQKAGDMWDSSLDLVFPRYDGRILPPNYLGDYFRRMIKNERLPELRFHDLRHTAATLLLKEGVNIKVVSEMLGHSSVTMTLNRYAHVLPTMQHQAVVSMDRLLS